ncbi:uncharacterized protein ACRADG_006795 isoform 2-T2 [Cochliomyia hominivorax]
MNSTKIVFGVALIAFCYISLSFSLKCFVCNSKDSCKKAQLYQCDPSLANATRSYVQIYHSGVHPNATSPYYECFKEYIKTSNNVEYYYKGCSYNNVQGCRLPFSNAVGSPTKHDCKQCSSDGCNPASRSQIDVITVFATLIVTAILRYVWH